MKTLWLHRLEAEKSNEKKANNYLSQASQLKEEKEKASFSEEYCIL